MRYARIQAGAIVEIVDLPGGAPAGSVVGAHASKPYLLPIEDTRPSLDAVAEVEEGPVVTILADKVTRVWTVRAKTSGELDALRATARRRVEAEFQARWQAPIDYIGHTWHGDQAAADDISGVLAIYREMERMGQPPPPTRSWTPYGALTGETVTRDQLAGLGIAIGVRKDALFRRKKLHQAAIAALTDAHEIADYDASAGWT